MALNLIPMTSQSLDQTQNPILTNFTVIDTAFSVDHAPYNSANEGWHNQVTLPQQVMAPVPSANNNIIYSLIPTVSPQTTINEVFIHKQIQGGTADIPFTASILSTNASPGNTSDGWTYLPSGILLKWGSVTGSFPNQVWQQILYPTAPNIPAFTQVFNVTLQPVSQDAIPATTQTYNVLSVNNQGGSFNNLGFWWTPHFIPFGSNQTQIFYFAIGF